MTRKGLRVHFDRRPGGLGKFFCRDACLLLKGTLLADLQSPCPLCDATAAANMAGWKVMLAWLTPDLPSGRQLPVAPRVDVPRVNRSDADLNEIDTTGFSVTKVPEGVVPRTNREGGFVHKSGQVVMDTIDFRSDEAVKRRMAGGMSKWGKGRVTGSTSVCSTWAVPAHPTRDSMANSADIAQDMRSAHMADVKSRQRNTPRRGRHEKPKQVVVRRYTV